MMSCQMLRLAIALTAAVLTFGPLGAMAAGRDTGLPAATLNSTYELVVFEADGCTYCQNFRSDVLPLYRDSTLGREVPIRFVNVSRSDETGMALSFAITIAPTVVLMREGREIDRIIGYTGPFNFLKLVNFMMGRSE
jgi:thioredoxin-related protein